MRSDAAADRSPKRHAGAERAAAAPLEGAVRAGARMSSSADRSRCSRGELVAPVAETPSRAASEAVVGMNMA